MATINAPNGDIGEGFSIATGNEDIRQRCIQRLKFFRGEWLLDRRAGTPWFQRVLTRPIEIGIVSAIIADTIANVEGVSAVEQVDATLDRETRKLRFSAQIRTIHGTITLGEEITA